MPKRFAVTATIAAAIAAASVWTSVPASADDPKASDPSISSTAKDSDHDGVLDAKSTAAALAAAITAKHPVEDLSQRSTTASVVANPNGSFTRTESASPVRLKRDGKWVDLDLNLVKRSDGSWSPAATTSDVRVGGGGVNEAVRVTLGNGASLGVTWPEKLPEPTVDGPVATYRVSDSADLLITVTGDGVNAHIRLNKKPADTDAVYELGLRADDVDVREAKDSLTFLDEDGKKVGQTSNLVAWDARVDAAGDPANTVDLETDLGNARVSGDVTTQPLELKAPEAFLDDPNTKYPVIIDPNVGLGINRDTWVRSGTSEQGSDAKLIVGKINGDSNTNPARSYIEFDTSWLSARPRVITSASLSLWQYYAYTCSGRQMSIHAAGSPWAASMTWPGPSANGFPGSYISTNLGASGCGQGRINADVTEMVKSWVPGGSDCASCGGWTNYGFRLMASTETQSSYERRFCSANPAGGHVACTTSAKVPQLIVTYYTYPNEASVPTVSISGSQVTVSSQVSDPDGDAVRAKFQVKDFLGNEVFKGYSGYVSSSATASLTLPPLKSGYYTVKAWANDGGLESPSGTSPKEFSYKRPVQFGATFEDGSEIIWNQDSTTPTVTAPSGTNVLTSEAAKVNGDGTIQMGTPDVPAEPDAAMPSDETTEPGDVEDSGSEPLGLPNTEGDPGDPSVGEPSIEPEPGLSSAANVPKGYKLYGNNRVDSTHYKSRAWYLWTKEWEGNWITGGWVKKGEVQINYAQTLNGGSSHLWNITTLVKYKSGYHYDYRYTAWCGVVRKNGRDTTCKTGDSTADSYDEEDLIDEWAQGYNSGTDRWYDFGTKHTGYAKYPLIRMKITWWADDGKTSFTAKARGWDIRHKPSWLLAGVTNGDQATYSVHPG